MTPTVALPEPGAQSTDDIGVEEARWWGDFGASRSILRAAGAVLAAGTLVKLAATGKEFVLAGIYGRSDAMDRSEEHI